MNYSGSEAFPVSKKKQAKRARANHRRVLKRAGRKSCLVYALREVGKEYPFYIGQTRCQLEVRLKFHIKSAMKIESGVKITPVQKHIYKLVSSGTHLAIECIDDKGIWDISEAVWIDRYLRDGATLFNVQNVIQNGMRRGGGS